MDKRTRRAGQVSALSKVQGNTENVQPHVGKRTAENRSPAKQDVKKTRTAFGDITNQDKSKIPINKKGQKKATKPKNSKKPNNNPVVVIPKSTDPLTSSQQDNKDLSWEVIELSQPTSQDSSSSGSQESNFSPLSEFVDDLNLKNLRVSQEVQNESELTWDDIDKENVNDPHQVALYVNDIFAYYKEREVKFRIPDYMSNQSDLSNSMRAILVDWLVEVQENFELNHETLYLAVKLVDHYLAKKSTTRDLLQLVGATAMFIACKFDERLPPVLDDFLYICDDAYKRDVLLEKERDMIKTVEFDLGIPLSYRFLRRYSKCGRAPIETLTLARYILEMSLMDYTFVRELDSKLASAALLLAMKMRDDKSWNATLLHYTGYKQEELTDMVRRLNAMISAAPNKQLATIRTKYQHKVFHEVAKTPTLTEEALHSLEENC